MKKLSSFVVLSAIISLSTSSFAISLTKDGVEGLEKRVSFRTNAIKRHFPGYKTKESSVSIEGEEYKIIEVKKFGKVFLILHPDKSNKNVKKVEVLDKRVKNTLDIKIGDKYSKTIDEKKHKCVTGIEALSGSVICWDKKERKPKFSFIFSGYWSGPDGKLPPKIILKNWKVSKIVWNKR